MLNTKIRLLLIAFMLLSAILAYPAPAWGCTCGIPGSPQEGFGRSKAVFVGTVTRVDEDSMKPRHGKFIQFYQQFVPPLPSMIDYDFHGRSVTFEVEESWRGVDTTHFTVQTGWGGDCGYRFQEGKQYLVYAHQFTDIPFFTGICSRTTALASATEDLNYLQTLPKLELTYTPSRLNPLMLGLGIVLGSTIVLGVVIWRRRRIRKQARK